MKKTKYLVFNEYINEILFSNRADAEEYVLSLAEENVYADYVRAVYCRGLTTEDYLYEAFDYYEPYKTPYGSLLLIVDPEFYISEVEEFE